LLNKGKNSRNKEQSVKHGEIKWTITNSLYKVHFSPPIFCVFIFSSFHFWNFTSGPKLYFIYFLVSKFEMRENQRKTTWEIESCLLTIFWPWKKNQSLCKWVSFNERSSIKMLSDFILPNKYRLRLREIFFSSLIFIFRKN